MFNYVQQKSDLIKNALNRNCSSTNKLSYKTNGYNLYETTYNLYAVCCHHGTMQGGHYTGIFVDKIFRNINSISNFS